MPFDFEDCDPDTRIFDSEYSEIKKIGPHHVAMDFPHFVLKEVVAEPIVVK